jgi:pimeloyl-ACP methyl ester carboxylesterase
MIHHAHTVTHDNIKLSLTTWGSAPPDVVFIHGFADGRYLWTPFATSIAEHAGALSIDLRGHGDSEWDPDGIYNIAKFVDDTQLVLDRHCSNNLVLVGHSMGAEIALRIAANNEERIRAIMLVDWAPGLMAASLAQLRNIFQLRMRTFESRPEYRKMLSEWMPLADEDMLSLAAEHSITHADSDYQHKFDPKLLDMPPSVATEELWHLLDSLTCDSVLVRGAASGVLTRRTAAEMTQRKASLRCETVGMAGHAIMMDNPKDFGLILQDFITDAGHKAVDFRLPFAAASLIPA